MGTPQEFHSFLSKETGISKEERDLGLYCTEDRVKIPEDMGIGCPEQWLRTTGGHQAELSVEKTHDLAPLRSVLCAVPECLGSLGGEVRGHISEAQYTTFLQCPQLPFPGWSAQRRQEGTGPAWISEARISWRIQATL